jgi:hypothetical protein
LNRPPRVAQHTPGFEPVGVAGYQCSALVVGH